LVEQLVLWAGFLGAWLLVVGPLHQARVELAEEDFERDRVQPVMDELGPPERVSAWWWLFPPLRLYFGHVRRERWQDRVLYALPDDDFEALSSFMSKARGWLFVGAGGLLIAVKETWELVEGHEWPTWLFWVFTPAMALGCAAYTAYRAMREGSVADQRRRQRAAQGLEAPGTPETSDPQ
jgi:hypothetical protein